jgi:hypothetical protein
MSRNRYEVTITTLTPSSSWFFLLFWQQTRLFLSLFNLLHSISKTVLKNGERKGWKNNVDGENLLRREGKKFYGNFFDKHKKTDPFCCKLIKFLLPSAHLNSSLKRARKKILS